MNTVADNPAALLAERQALLADSAALKETARVPVVPFIASVAQRMFGSSYRDLFYDYDRAGRAEVEFYKVYPCDATTFSGFTSGRSNEIAESSMIDWPGKPGSRVSIYSSHQVIEHEYVSPEEYEEMIGDFTGFMIRKYIPRAFPGLKGLAGVGFVPNIILSTSLLAPLCTPEAQAACQKLAEIGRCDAEAAAKFREYADKLTALGIPPLFSGVGEVPFDIIGDYFRGTMGILMDQLEYEDELLRLCDILADLQIASWQHYKSEDTRGVRISFPMHKGMDGFMSPKQYERLYWRPFRRMLDELIGMGVTPFLYTEGHYDTRLEQLCDLPKGKAIVHFENVDMKRAKETVGRVACISGNLPHYLLEFGSAPEVSDAVKRLIDTCAPGGGYIFDTDACLENARRENLDAMFDTVYSYR